MRVKIVSKPIAQLNSFVEKIKEISFRLGFEVVDSDFDYVIAVGGDGTLLRAVKQGKPVIAVKAGRRGLLMDVPMDKIEDALLRLKKGDYKEEEYMLLEMISNDKVELAFNEAGILYDRPEAIRIGIQFDTEKVSVEGDGVLVSTPQGSSGWGLSITNSLLYKDLNAIEIIFVNPIFYYLRSVVIPPKTLTLKLEDKGYPQTARVVVDGEVATLIKTNQQITIRVSKNRAKILRFYNLDLIGEVLHAYHI
ncbi:NAD(+)/NADH kinase [Sulfolobus tengchongensis]|uniref:NAD kinase n=1 Tax=Sulfolobus tengchongensis TaxID=207809 RepID=A0AAX4L2T3_9CREN